MATSEFWPGSNIPVLPTAAAVACGLPLAVFLLNRAVAPRLDPREPPVVHPTIPFLGHVVNFFREHTAWFENLYKQNPLPIASVPMLNGYIYVIHDPTLIAAALRHRNLSFEPFELRFTATSMGMPQHQVDIFAQEGKMREVTEVIHQSLMGENLFRMNARALADIAKAFNAVGAGEVLEVPDVAEWLRDIVTSATMQALYGKSNPFTKEDIPDLMEFEQGIGYLASGIAPKHIAPKALAARERIQARLRPYYVAHLDQGDDVSAFVKDRAAFERASGLKDDEIGIPELGVPFVATSNTIPTFLWFFMHVFADPDLVARIRGEVEAVAEVVLDPATGRRVSASINITRLEKECPTMHACYRETTRLYSNALGNRAVLEDTTLTDSAGREYLLKKGVNVQWSAGVAHKDAGAWGTDADEFRPERFIDTPAAEEKKRRGGMIPFGGGRNLCPGRQFAQAENLGIVSSLALGFVLEGVKVPQSKHALLGNAIKRPVWGSTSPAIRVKRRSGWEDVIWSFKC